MYFELLLITPKATPIMKRRSFFTALASLAVVLLVVAGTSFYTILAQSPLNLLQKGGVMVDPQAAIFVPKQAPAMLSLLTNPTDLERLRQLEARPGERRKTRGEIEQIQQNLLANTDLNYRRDIQPWLGDEITFAVTSLDYDRNPKNGNQPGYLLVAGIRDGELAKEFLQAYFSQSAIARTSDLVFEQYKGVNLIYRRSLLPNSPQPSLASAVVGNKFILFANAPQVLKNALTNVQVPDLNLANTPAYQNALQAIQEPRIGVGFVNLPAVAAWTNGQAIPDDLNWEQLLTLTLSVNRQGLVAQTGLTGIAANVANRQPVLREPVAALQYVPASSSFTAAGTNLKQLWADLASLAKGNPIESLLDATLARVQKQWGVNLPQDIFSWVEGEYALALIPHPDRPADWVFVAEKTAEAEEAIAKLDDYAKTSGYSVGELPIEGTEITAWTKLVAAKELIQLNAQVQGVHTQVENYEIFATSIPPISAALSAEPLLTSEKFQKAIQPFPTQNDGYVYVDWQESQPQLQQFGIFRILELAGKPFFDHLDTLTLSSRGSENGVRRATLFFNLS
jgi:hypothetical protein